MKLIKKVSRVEVKRAFVKTYLLRKFGIARKNKKVIPYETAYLIANKKANTILKKMSEKELDKYIGKWKKRLNAYEKADWYIGEVSTTEVGVWRKAGGLPHAWTNHSLAYTAKMVKNALKKQ